MLPTFLKAIGAYSFYESWLVREVSSDEVPEHVGIILDGNRRWGFERYGDQLNGHYHGVKNAEDFLEWCLGLGINTMTLYVFSTENFRRPKEEVDTVLSLIEEEARKLLADKHIHENFVRVKAIGRLELLPA